MSPRRRTSGTLVIGLGRFGEAVAASLDRLDKEILAIEKDMSLVQHFTGLIPIVQADASDMEALEQAGAAEFSAAVVGVGSALEASVLITANLVDLGVPSIWAKATSREHGRILKRIGAHHVIYPEFDAGRRAAHLVGGDLLDYIEMDQEELAIAKMRPPRELEGFTLAESQVETRYHVRVLGVISQGESFRYADSQTLVEDSDILIVSGSTAAIGNFSERPR
ncbi:TrkA family potassium uptake protein [Scrofimicrobium sp. R131]|uniref:TrkA family potassium uptake protein n=1 Tax=Scrofimicrobium appendicitidis TaxID=3079930 RepID=A0AAU7V8Y6_9ACTO